jgi:hypothetical protein
MDGKRSLSRRQKLDLNRRKIAAIHFLSNIQVYILLSDHGLRFLLTAVVVGWGGGGLIYSLSYLLEVGTSICIQQGESFF